MLLVFLSLGIVLEVLHGFKVGWYLNVSNSTRRLMLTLAHAHGTLLSLVNIAFASTHAFYPKQMAASGKIASPCLLLATITIPLGFCLGGWVIYGGDPSLGILLVPVGAMLMLTAVITTAMAMQKARRECSEHSSLTRPVEAAPATPVAAHPHPASGRKTKKR